MRLLRPILLAALLAPLSAAAQTPHADGPTLSVETRAQDLYVTARDHFRANEFSAAREDFRRSLDLVDSPNTRMYLGRALRRLGLLPEAYATLDRAAVDAERRAITEPRYAATRESARAEANEIRGDISLLTVRLPELPANASIRVAGSEVPVTAIGYPLPFVPGEVIVEFDAPGFAPAREILILAPGGDAVVELTPRAEATDTDTAQPAATIDEPRRAPGNRVVSLRPVEPAPPRLWPTTRVLGVTALSVGVATVITGVVFGSLAWSEHETLSAQQPRDASLIAQGEFHRDLANVLIGSGSAIAVGGMLLFWLSGRSLTDSQRPPVQVDVGFNGSGPTLRVGGNL